MEMPVNLMMLLPNTAVSLSGQDNPTTFPTEYDLEGGKMSKALTVAIVIKQLQSMPLDYEVVVIAQERPIKGMNEPGARASGDARKVYQSDPERCVYIEGRG